MGKGRGKASLLGDGAGADLQRHDRWPRTTAGRVGLYTFALLAIAFWALVAEFEVQDRASFLNKIGWSLHAPPGSPSKVAEDFYEANFVQKLPALPYGVAAVVYPTAGSKAGPVKSDARFYELTRLIVESTVQNCTTRMAETASMCYWRSAAGWYVTPDGNDTYADSSTSASSLQWLLSDRYVSHDGRSTLIVIDVDDGWGNEGMYVFWDALQARVEEHLTRTGFGRDVTVGYTQEQMLLRDARTHTIGDFEQGDLHTLPIAWFILFLTVGPTAVITLITLPMAAALSFLVLTKLADQPNVHFASFSPSIFVSMIVALSLDFSLFLLTRYREEVVEGVASHKAVGAAMRNAGRVVVVSGLILAASFAGLGFINMNLVANIGIGGSVCVIAVVLVNITLTPALLIVMGPWCCRPMVRSRWCQCQPSRLGLWLCRTLCCGACGTRKETEEDSLRPMGFASSAPGLGLRRGEHGGAGSRDSSTEWNGPRLGRGVGADIWRGTGSTDRGDHGVLLTGSGHYVDGRSESAYFALNGDDPSNVGVGSFADSDSRPLDSARQPSCWIRIGEFTRRRKLWIVAVMLVLTVAPFGLLAVRLRYSVDQGQLAPRDGPALIALNAAEDRGLPAGLLGVLYIATGARESDPGATPMPCRDDSADLFNIAMHHHADVAVQIPGPLRNCAGVKALFGTNGTCTFDPAQDSKYGLTDLTTRFCPHTCPEYCPAGAYSVISPAYFAVTRELRADAMVATGLGDADVFDVATMPDGSGDAVTPAQATAYVVPGANATAYASVPGQLYRHHFFALANAASKAALMQLVPRGQAFGVEAATMTESLRDVVARPKFEGYSPVVVADVGELIDSVKSVYDQAPAMVAAVASVCTFVFAAIAFRSLLIAARMLVTIAVTLVWLAGACTFVFQDLLGLDGMYWISLVCTAPLVCGLVCDYDAFTIARVYEYRHQGFTTAAAITRGLGRSGGVITTAGLIMTIAFSALLLSSEMVLNQFGFVLVVSSLVDSLIVRTFLVPALLHTGVEWNWFPGRVPKATRNDIL